MLMNPSKYYAFTAFYSGVCENNDHPLVDASSLPSCTPPIQCWIKSKPIAQGSAKKTTILVQLTSGRHTSTLIVEGARGRQGSYHIFKMVVIFADTGTSCYRVASNLICFVSAISLHARAVPLCMALNSLPTRSTCARMFLHSSCSMNPPPAQ